MKEFMTEFYSPSKTQILRNKIATFAQALMETIAEAYERFNDYIRVVPHHKFSREDVVRKFYQGLTTTSRGIIDASAGGSIIELTPTQVFKLFKKVADKGKNTLGSTSSKMKESDSDDDDMALFIKRFNKVMKKNGYFNKNKKRGNIKRRSNNFIVDCPNPNNKNKSEKKRERQEQDKAHGRSSSRH